MANKLLRFLEDDSAVQYFPIPVGLDILNKERGIKQYIAYMLDRTNCMFEYEGLPDTIPAYVLELYLQTFGYAAFVEVKSTNPIYLNGPTPTPPGLYVFFGGVGGERDIYYRPKLFTAANPRLKGSIQSTIVYPGDDYSQLEQPCVLMSSDRNYMGLLPLFNRYAQQLVENDISIRSAQINTRAQVGISCSTDRDKESARKYLDDLEAGKLGILGETAFLDGISVSDVSGTSPNNIIQLIELHQYLKANWYNELGLQSNYNMKREYVSAEEMASGGDVLLPLVDDMLRCRQEALELINSMYGLNITVKKSSAWERHDARFDLNLEGGGDGDAEIQAPVSEEVQDGAEEPAGDGFQSTETTVEEVSEREETSGGSGESSDANANGVEVTINLNVNGGENEIDVSVPQSETLEEPEESDVE